MNKLSNYSKFDHLDDGGSEEIGCNQIVTTATTIKNNLSSIQRRHPTNPKRFIFEYGGKGVYQWEQSLYQVILYVPAPKVSAGEIRLEITPKHLRLGLRGVECHFLDNDTARLVDTTESTWCIEVDDDGIRKITIYLQKVEKGYVWTSALNDSELDSFLLKDVQKQILMERFQEENPGFDFSGADFNGNVVDPRSFMGGVRYD